MYETDAMQGKQKMTARTMQTRLLAWVLRQMRGRPVGWILVGFLLGFSWIGGVMAQQGYQTRVVRDIKVTGNRRVTRETILANMRTKPGRPYNKAVFQEDLRKLSGLGYFRDVQGYTPPSSDGQVSIEVVVTEHKNLVTQVVVKNARHVKLDDLPTLGQIKAGVPLNPTLNKVAAREIEQFYHAKGYTLAKVVLDEGSRPSDQRVVFNVTEGPIIRIRKVNFVGNRTLAWSGRLKTQIQSKEALLRLIGGMYNPHQIEQDVRKLEEYYRENGYLDASVSVEPRFTPNFQYVDLTFHVHEGPRYRVHQITVDGVENLEQAQVESVLQLKKGDHYKEAVVQQDLQYIQGLYGWRGYKVAARRELYYPEEGLAHVRYQVLDQPRPPAKIGQIIIYGNETTRDRVIRRLLPLYPGQTLQFPLLREAERNLIRSRLFEADPSRGQRPTVRVIEDPENPNSEFKDIEVRVAETTTGSLLFGLGLNSDAGIVGSIVLNERNFDLFRPPTSIADILEFKAFRGGGQEFRLEAVPGTELQRYSATWREPFLFDRPISLTVSGYYRDRIFVEYTERRVGGRFTLGKQLNPMWSVTGGLRIENVEVDSVPFFAPNDLLDVVGNSFLVAPRIAVIRDNRDSFLRATEGGRIELSYEHVFGDFTYPVLSAEASRYFTTWQRRDGSGKQVLAVHGQVSYAGDDVPVFERFYAGGYRSLRGFSFRGVGPEKSGFKVGGNFMMLASLEYQVPVLANDQVYAVAFLDSGTVESDVEVTDYRVTAGFGLRMVVPMMGPVPIALDFGFPLLSGPNDNEQLFSFTLAVSR
ncbi:MAG: outer membrane protein assembly factor BamA [Gemmataceae bacterium]